MFQYVRSELKDNKSKLLINESDHHNLNVVINYQRPDTWINGMRIMVHAGWVGFMGDLGEAIYGWGGSLTASFLTGIDFHYFLSKCQASEVGREFRQWDRDVFASALEQYLADEREQEHKVDWIEEAVEQGLGDSEAETEQLLIEAYHSGNVHDAEEISMIRDFGRVPHVRSIYHFVGMQNALRQLFETANLR